MRKLNKEQIKEIKELFEEGKKVIDLARMFNVFPNTIKYYVDEEFRKRLLEYNKERYRNLSPEEKKKYQESQKEYQKNYHKNKYKNDEEFKERHRKRAREYRRKNYIKKEDRKC